MKKNLKILGAALLIVVVFSIFGGGAQATVGGPTFIHTFKYNPEDESVYYIQQSFSGKGCPPELFRLSLNSGNSEVVYSCEDGFADSNGEGENYSATTEIQKIIKDFKLLTPINLKKNNIEIDVDFVRTENYSSELDEILRRHFKVSVHQNGAKVAEFSASGCSLDQPFIFEGYAIPGFNKKIVMLLSTKGDCFEGGYIRETLNMVGGVDNLDKTNISNSFKGASVLVPNEGTLVVFESEEIKKEDGVVNPGNDVIPKPASDNEFDQFEERNIETENDNFISAIVVVLGAAVAVCAGLILGRIIYKKRTD